MISSIIDMMQHVSLSEHSCWTSVFLSVGWDVTILWSHLSQTSQISTVCCKQSPLIVRISAELLLISLFHATLSQSCDKQGLSTHPPTTSQPPHQERVSVHRCAASWWQQNQTDWVYLIMNHFYFDLINPEHCVNSVSMWWMNLQCPGCSFGSWSLILKSSAT